MTTELEHLRRAAAVAGLDPAAASLPQERHLVVNAFRLHVLDWGGAGPPLLFLHGGALSAHSWDLVCLALGEDHRCVAVDQRGHGDSEWSPELDYGTDAHVRDIAGLIDGLELGRPIVVGQSLGAINGLVCAARHPERLAALVMVDAGPWVQRRGTGRIVDFVLTDAELPTVEDFVERARRFNTRRDPELLRHSLVRNLRPVPGGGWTWKYDRRHLTRERIEGFAAELGALEELLDEVRCPVLVVRGAESDVLTAADAERLAARLPDGRATTVAGAGHTVQGDNPAGLAAALREFAASALA
jgi:pimeloyl-ACP methyl ester carboxylesterase